MRRHTRQEWESRLAECGEKCVYCGKPATEKDHVDTWKAGEEISNIVPACRSCNGQKGSLRPSEFFMRRGGKYGMLRPRYTAALLLLTMAGCASPASRILTSANGYTYWIDRRAERCPADTEFCKQSTVTLNTWFKALGEANAALQRGGKLPLQLEALKRVEKESKKWRP